MGELQFGIETDNELGGIEFSLKPRVGNASNLPQIGVTTLQLKTYTSHASPLSKCCNLHILPNNETLALQD